MRKIYQLLIPAFIAVVLCTSCEDPMEEMAVEKDAKLETVSELPPKSEIQLPPRYRPTGSSSDSGN